MASLALPLIGGALGALGGLFGNRPQTTTSNFNQNQTSSQSGGWTQNLTDEQASSLPMLADYIKTRLLTPDAGLAPIKAAATANLNAGYAALPQQLRAAQRNTGGGASGNFGTSMRLAALDRLHQLGLLDANFAQMALGQQDAGAQAVQQLLTRDFGQQSWGSGQSSTSGSSTQTGPGNMVGGAFGGGLGGALTGYMLGKKP